MSDHSRGVKESPREERILPIKHARPDKKWRKGKTIRTGANIPTNSQIRFAKKTRDFEFGGEATRERGSSRGVLRGERAG